MPPRTGHERPRADNRRSAADEAVAVALAQGLTQREAAAMGSVSERTVRRRQDDPAFRQRVDELRGNMVSAAVGALAEAAVDAVATLRMLLTDGPPAVQARAAVAILEQLVRVRSESEFERRLRALENDKRTEGGLAQ